MTPVSVGAVVLAAGSGSRLGGPKLRMVAGGKSFLAHTVEVLASAGAGPICCVVGAEDASWACQEALDVAVCVNPDPARGMLSSVIVGLAFVRGEAAGTLIAPVDHPYVCVSTIKSLLEIFAGFPDHVIKPVYRGRTGHPVVLPCTMFQAVLEASGMTTLREVLAQTGVPVRYVEVDDEGVLVNVNTQADIR
jgi:molybdenum cofactor cytidylyltransferase